MKLLQFLESITCSIVTLSAILADAGTTIYFQYAVPESAKDCFGRESVTETAITIVVSFVFITDMVLHWIAGEAPPHPAQLSPPAL